MAKKLIVGIDIRDLKIAKTGAKTYLEEIYNYFRKNNYDCKFHFFNTTLPVYTGTNKLLKLIEHIRFIFWKQVVLPILVYTRKCDILFCTDYFVPYYQAGYKAIPVFHDAFFWEYPEHYNKYWLMVFRNLGVKAAKKSPFIVVPTEYTKSKIAIFMHLSPDQIIPIPLAPKTIASVKKNLSYVPDINLNTSKFILHVGTFEKRKNLTGLIEAFIILRNNGYVDFSLILVGQSSPKSYMDDSSAIKEMIKKHDIEKYVLMPGYVNDEELGYFYKSAELYVFPSVNEGFGLPVLEAFNHNIPVIVSNNTCLPEIGADAVLTFDPYNPSDIEQKIRDVIDNPELKKEMIKKGQERLKAFSWEKTSKNLVEVFKKAQYS